MPFSRLLLFALIHAGAVASPRSGIAALVARAMTSGTRGILGFALGMSVGDRAWFTVAAGGIALLGEVFAPVFVALKVGGVLYLVCLAWKT